jgi:hypothetical protein
MAAKKITDLTVATSPSTSDVMYIVQNLQDKQISVASLFSDIPVPVDAANGVIIGDTPETIVSGAISTTNPVTHLGLSGVNIVTIGAGVEGQLKFIVAASLAGPSTTTINANIYNTSINFTTEGMTAILMYTGGKWAFFGGTATIV